MFDFQLVKNLLQKNVCKTRNEVCKFANGLFRCATFAPKFGFMQRANILFRNFAPMKISHLFFGSLLLALVACNPSQREAKQLLRQAESVLETHPDSALHLIDSAMHMEIYFTEAQRMEMALLQARAIYGDDRDATDPTKSNGNILFDKVMNHIYTSPDLDRAPYYFAQKGQPQKAALAALYKGYDLQTIYADSLALHSFEEATDYALRAGDSLTAARAFFQMGRHLHWMDKYGEAAAALDSADRYFGNRLYERAFVQNMMGLNQCFLEEFYDAAIHLANSIDFALESGNEDALWRAWFNQGVMLGGDHFDNRDAGLEVLRLLEAENTGLKLAAKAYGINKLFFNYNVRHKIKPVSDDSTAYYGHVWASAMQFDRKYKLGGADVFCFYGRQHDLYPLFLTHWITADETVFGDSYGVLKNYRRQQQRNDYLNLRNAMAEKQLQKQHKTQIFCIMALVALLLIIGAMLFWLKRKPKVEMAETQPEEPKSEIQVLEQPKENPFVKQELTNRLRLILAAARIEKNAYDPKMEWKPLVRQVMNGKETAFESAVSVIEAAYPGLQAMIAEQFPDLNETDAKVCLLSCSGLSNTEMGDLLGLSVHSINKSRSELRKKLGFEPDELKDKL